MADSSGDAGADLSHDRRLERFIIIACLTGMVLAYIAPISLKIWGYYTMGWVAVVLCPGAVFAWLGATLVSLLRYRERGFVWMCVFSAGIIALMLMLDSLGLMYPH